MTTQLDAPTIPRSLLFMANGTLSRLTTITEDAIRTEASATQRDALTHARNAYVDELARRACAPALQDTMTMADMDLVLMLRKRVRAQRGVVGLVYRAPVMTLEEVARFGGLVRILPAIARACDREVDARYCEREKVVAFHSLAGAEWSDD